METDITAMMRGDASHGDDRLKRLRTALSRWRDVAKETLDLEERLDSLRRAKLEIERVVLPDVFAEVSVNSISLPAEGNLPAVDATLTDFFRASIPVAWPPEQREAAFATLDELGVGGVIQSVVSVTFPRGSERDARELSQRLTSEGYAVRHERSVHHKTLTSAVKELCESGRRPSDSTLERIGAEAGKTVRVRFT